MVADCSGGFQCFGLELAGEEGIGTALVHQQRQGPAIWTPRSPAGAKQSTGISCLPGLSVGAQQIAESLLNQGLRAGLAIGAKAETEE